MTTSGLVDYKALHELRKRRKIFITDKKEDLKNCGLIDDLFDVYPIPQIGYDFDKLPDDFQLKERFVCFTGKFKFGSRKQCINEVSRRGGCPSDVNYYTDYFFVADNLSQDKIVSSSLFSAIRIRTLFGNPLIFDEKTWKEIIINTPL